MGYYYDQSTGLYHLSHRYYDPGTTRFLTLDPAYLVTGERYWYCGDSPTVLDDPTGLDNWFTRAYDWGVEHFDPALWVMNGYSNPVTAAPDGKSWWTSFGYGMQGALGVAGTVFFAADLGGSLAGMFGDLGMAEEAAQPGNLVIGKMNDLLGDGARSR